MENMGPELSPKLDSPFGGSDGGWSWDDWGSSGSSSGVRVGESTGARTGNINNTRDVLNNVAHLGVSRSARVLGHWWKCCDSTEVDSCGAAGSDMIYTQKNLKACRDWGLGVGARSLKLMP